MAGRGLHGRLHALPLTCTHACLQARGLKILVSTRGWLPEQGRGRILRFLANVDPVDVARALNGLRQETTLVVIVSKTFTTAETMLNARTVRCAIPLKTSLTATPQCPAGMPWDAHACSL